MIAVIIGAGDWKDVAGRTAFRVRKCTGLDTFILNEKNFKLPSVSHPSWLKCHVLDSFPKEQDFLVMDADIFCCRRWNPKVIFESLEKPFCVVKDAFGEDTINEKESHGLPREWTYINGGLTMFNRRHRSVWNEVWAKHPSYGSWYEQTALNVALFTGNVETTILPKRFNWLLTKSIRYVEDKFSPFASAGPDDINLHFSGSTLRTLNTLFDEGDNLFPL